MKHFRNWLASVALVAGLFSQVAAAPVRAAALDVPAPVTAASEIRIPTPFGDLVIPLPMMGQAQPAAAEPAQAQADTAAPQPADNPAPAPADNPAPAPTPEAKGKLIYIDAGHGAWDSGAIHKAGDGSVDLMEKNANLGIATRLSDLLRQNGYEVVMTRNSDTALTSDGSTPAELQARVDAADKAGADLFLSVHNNGLDNHAVRGTEVWYCSDRPFSDQNKRLATEMESALVRNLQQAGYSTAERGIKDDSINGHYAVLAPSNLDRPTKMVGVIGESLFVTNDQDAAQLQRPEIQQAIAQGYFDGIQAFFANS